MTVTGGIESKQNEIEKELEPTASVLPSSCEDIHGTYLLDALVSEVGPGTGNELRTLPYQLNWIDTSIRLALISQGCFFKF